MIYFISGLGADERVFQFLNLNGVEHRFIQWLSPLPKEGLASYCQRLSAQIDSSGDVILIGVSFGGVIAQEIAKLMAVRKVIIISSVKTSNEFSWSIKLVRKLQLHRLVPFWLMKLANRYTADYYFSTTTKAESKLLQEIIADTDPHFLTWAIHELMNWKNESYPSNLVHIHGTADRIFPIKYISNALEIPNGGHFMMVNKVLDIEQFIFATINSLPNEPTEQ